MTSFEAMFKMSVFILNNWPQTVITQQCTHRLLPLLPLPPD